jgi:diguanylate cyclase (GGDEF)-like protein
MRQDAADSLPCGLAEVDAKGLILDANSVFTAWTGLLVSELIGRPFTDIALTAEETSEPHRATMPGLRFVHHIDGSRRPVLVNESLDGPDGHRLLTILDAAAQHAYSQDLAVQNALTQRTQTRLELVIDASIAFAAAETEVELAAVLADTTAKAYAAEESAVFLLNESNAFELVVGENPFGGLDDADTLAGQGLALRSVLKISGLAEAYAVSHAVGRGFENAGLHAMIIAPIHQADQPLGILAAFFRHPRTFDDQASPLADALSGQAAQAIANLRLQARLQHAAMHDDTTGLPNRRLLEDHLDDRALHAENFVAVIFIDLDGFKVVNDRLGHHIGDQLLREVGRRLQEEVREGDLVARYGGDEFVVACEVTSETAALEIAERLRSSIAALYEIPPDGSQIRASVGLAITSAERLLDSADRLLRSADQAMYRAKNAGGNRVVIADLDQSALPHAESPDQDQDRRVAISGA